VADAVATGFSSARLLVYTVVDTSQVVGVYSCCLGFALLSVTVVVCFDPPSLSGGRPRTPPAGSVASCRVTHRVVAGNEDDL